MLCIFVLRQHQTKKRTILLIANAEMQIETIVPVLIWFLPAPFGASVAAPERTHWSELENAIKTELNVIFHYDVGVKIRYLHEVYETFSQE